MADHPHRPEVETQEPSYLAAHLEERLATDGRVNEPQLEVSVEADVVIVEGVVPTPERREAVTIILQEACPARRVDNRTKVADYGARGVSEGERIA